MRGWTDLGQPSCLFIQSAKSLIFGLFGVVHFQPDAFHAYSLHIGNLLQCGVFLPFDSVGVFGLPLGNAGTDIIRILERPQSNENCTGYLSQLTRRFGYGSIFNSLDNTRRRGSISCALTLLMILRDIFGKIGGTKTGSHPIRLNSQSPSSRTLGFITNSLNDARLFFSGHCLSGLQFIRLSSPSVSQHLQYLHRWHFPLCFPALPNTPPFCRLWA